jgi:hypothetical protein
MGVTNLWKLLICNTVGKYYINRTSTLITVLAIVKYINRTDTMSDD